MPPVFSRYTGLVIPPGLAVFSTRTASSFAPPSFQAGGEIDVERVVPAVVMEKASAVQEDRGVVVNAVEVQGMPWPLLLGQQRTIPDETNAAVKHIIAAGRVFPAAAAGIESRRGHLRGIGLARVIVDPPPARDRRPLRRGRAPGASPRWNRQPASSKMRDRGDVSAAR